MTFRKESLRTYQIHCRVQVKNYKDFITAEKCKEFLIIITDKCMPNQDTDTRTPSQICVNILINFGAGGLKPFAFVHESTPLRNDTVQTKYICLALTTNINDNNQKCFTDLYSSILDIIKDTAKGYSSSKNASERRMSMGNMYYDNNINTTEGSI